MKELELKLSVDEVNQILEGLGNLPFKQVFNLIGKIQSQAAEQLQELPPPTGGNSPAPAQSAKDKLSSD